MRYYQSEQAKKTASPVLVLLGLNILFFVLSALIPDMTKLFMLVPSKVVAGEVWRIFTSMFLHAGFAHILFNMYALIIFGPLIEAKIGRKRFWIAYFLAGLIAALAYIAYSFALGTPDAAAVGASGAIMGILGLVILLLPHLQVLFFFIIPMSMRTAGIIFAAIDIIGLFNPASGIAHVAHLGGLIFGLLFGWYLLKKKKLFTQQFANKSFHVHLNPSGTTKKQSSKKNSEDYAKTIELTKGELDDYFKYGKL